MHDFRKYFCVKTYNTLIAIKNQNALEMFRIKVDSFGTIQRQILKINVLLNQRPVYLLHQTNCDFNDIDPSNTV